MTLETRAVYPVELELREDGRRLTGRFPYSQGPGDRMATVANRGRTRKERISGDAFGYQIRRFKEVQQQYSQVAQDALDTRPRHALLNRNLERRNVHILSGHDFDRPLGSMAQGAEIESTREAVTFSVTSAASKPINPPTWWTRSRWCGVRDDYAASLPVSTSRRQPPFRTPKDLEPEPGNADVMVRVVSKTPYYPKCHW